MPEEQRVIFQNTIDAMHERFLQVVVESRPGYETTDELRPIADGRTYTSEEALRVELVDGIAYLDEVIDKAKVTAGVANARVVTYHHSAGHDGNIYSRLAGQVNLLHIDLPDIFGDGLPGFHYLWMPAD
jgi:protease-4